MTIFRNKPPFAVRMDDRFERKRVLVVGWLIGLPVSFLIMLAPNWEWVVFANVLQASW